MPPDLVVEDRERLATARWLPDVGPFGAFGRSWVLRSDDPALTSLIADLYGDLRIVDEGTAARAVFQVLPGDDDRGGLVARDGLRIGDGSTPATAMSALVWGANRWLLDAASHELLLLHAGGVVRDDGVAVVLPAASESGKSTLTTGLLERGFSYLSDEAVSIHRDGTVSGYAKPVSIDRGAWEVLARHRPSEDSPGASYLERQWHIRASRISGVARGGRLAAVIFPRYDPAAPLSLIKLSPSQALLRAGNCTFAPPGRAIVELRQVRALAAALAGIPAYELVSGELGAACDAVIGLFEDLS